MVIRDPLPESTRSGFKVLVSMNKGKWNMLVFLKDLELFSPKSSVQTAIDLQITEGERLADK